MKTENELIAEFMGGNKSVHPNSGLEYWFIPTPPTDGHTREAKILKYDTSWDWLMPVVTHAKKLIKDAGWGTPTEKEAWRRLKPVLNEISNINIKGANYCLVEFIRWYNSQNS